MYDITDSHMKIGVAFPIPNPSFKYWTTAWSVLDGWTASNLTLGRYWTGYDDDRASAQLSGASIPDNTTFNILSAIKRYWNDSDATITSSITCYYSMAVYVSTMTGAGSPVVRVQMQTDLSEAFSTPTDTTLFDRTSTDASFTLVTGTKQLNSPTSDRFARLRINLRDATVIVCAFDCIGVMFDPFNLGNGYQELTDIHPVDRFRQKEQTFSEDVVTRLGTIRRNDTSGGARLQSLTGTYSFESLATYQILKRFYDINHGTPDLPGVPLLIEPNLPGWPPTMMVNMSEPTFPLDRMGRQAGFYGGTVTFTSIWT